MNISNSIACTITQATSLFFQSKHTTREYFSGGRDTISCEVRPLKSTEHAEGYVCLCVLLWLGIPLCRELAL